MIQITNWNDLPVAEHLYAQAVGAEVLDYVKHCEIHALARRVDSQAMSIVKGIKRILEDKTLDDPTCFDQIEAIMKVYYTHGLRVDRYTELD